MPEFFVVDRYGTCETGRALELRRPRYDFAHLTAKDLQTPAEIADLLRELFPTGLSLHGQRYLFDRYAYGQGVIAVSPMIELVAELVRRSRYSTRPSRFECVFGNESLEAARSFRELHGQQHHAIVRVEADEGFRADMRLLSLGASGASALSLADKYWRGQASDKPQWEILLRPPVQVRECVEPVEDVYVNSPWLRIVKDERFQMGPTIPYILGAMRIHRNATENGSPETWKGELRSLLRAMRDDVPPPESIVIQPCGTLEALVASARPRRPEGRACIQSSHEGRGLYYAVDGSTTHTLDSLCDALWNIHQEYILAGRFSREQVAGLNGLEWDWVRFDDDERGQIKATLAGSDG